MTLRDDLNVEPDAKIRSRMRAEGIRAALLATWDGLPITRGRVRLDFDAQPQLIRDQQGAVIGIDALVRVFQDGIEQRVDPHRICINPPVLAVTGSRTEARTLPGSGTAVTVVVPDLELNPRRAYLDWLFDNIRDFPSPAGFRTRGTVTTVFAAAGDGFAQSQDLDGPYSSARAGADLTTSADQYAGQEFFGGASYKCVEGFEYFDTSSIPDGDTVSDAALSLYGQGDFSTTDFVIEARIFVWSGGGLTTADWVAGADLSGKTLCATFNTSGFSTTAYNDFTSEAGFPAQINKTGNTEFIVCSKNQTDNVAPTGTELVQWYGEEQAGTTQDPKLVVTHAAAADKVQRLALLGVG